MITYKPEAGENISETARQMCQLAKLGRRKEKDADLIRRMAACLSVQDRCRLLGQQDCFNCLRLECCDNISPEARAARERSEKGWASANSRED